MAGPYGPRDIKMVFEKHDRDGRGYIPCKKLVQVLRRIGWPLSDVQFRNWLVSLGIQPNGDIKYADFVDMLFADVPRPRPLTSDRNHVDLARVKFAATCATEKTGLISKQSAFHAGDPVAQPLSFAADKLRKDICLNALIDELDPGSDGTIDKVEVIKLVRQRPDWLEMLGELAATRRDDGDSNSRPLSDAADELQKQIGLNALFDELDPCNDGIISRHQVSKLIREKPEWLEVLGVKSLGSLYTQLDDFFEILGSRRRKQGSAD